MDNNDCPICFCVLDESNIKTTSCSHQFCRNCIDEWLHTKSTCPLCRRNIKNITNPIQTIIPFEPTEPIEPYEPHNIELNNDLVFFSIAYNALRIELGMGGLMYSS